MRRADLLKVQGFADWATTPDAQKFLPMLAEVVDTEVGDTGYAMPDPHWAHVNLGIQDAVRRVRRIISNPLMAPDERPAAPPATYGIPRE